MGAAPSKLCRQQRPDVITMDMVLPVMSGVAATEYIMAHCPTPILVVSASSNRGELFRLYEVLAAGAVDVLEKPSGTALDGAWEQRFVSAVKLVARVPVVTRPPSRGLRSATTDVPAHALSRPISRPDEPAVVVRPTDTGDGTGLRDGRSPQPALRHFRHAVVAIGASTGGPGALVEVLRSLPPTFQLPVLFVLHISEPFGQAFAEWLDGQTPRQVLFAREGVPVAAAAGQVVVAPGGRHLTVRDGRLHLNLDPERHSCRPSVDVLFELLAQGYGATAAACLLTGMGKDGAQGLKRVREAGGLTIAQDEATSVVYGMPREAALLGAASRSCRFQKSDRALGGWRAPSRRCAYGGACMNPAVLVVDDSLTVRMNLIELLEEADAAGAWPARLWRKARLAARRE